MATKKTKATGVKTSKGAKTSKVTMPKGFAQQKSSLDGFFAREPGNTIQGRMRGDFTVEGKFGTKKVYRIEITEGETQVGDGEMVGAGALVGIDETGFTKKLGDLDQGTEVFVGYEGRDEDQVEERKGKMVVIRNGAHRFVIGTK